MSNANDNDCKHFGDERRGQGKTWATLLSSSCSKRTLSLVCKSVTVTRIQYSCARIRAMRVYENTWHRGITLSRWHRDIHHHVIQPPLPLATAERLWLSRHSRDSVNPGALKINTRHTHSRRGPFSGKQRLGWGSVFFGIFKTRHTDTLMIPCFRAMSGAGVANKKKATERLLAELEFEALGAQHGRSGRVTRAIRNSM